MEKMNPTTGIKPFIQKFSTPMIYKDRITIKYSTKQISTTRKTLISQALSLSTRKFLCLIWFISSSKFFIRGSKFISFNFNSMRYKLIENRRNRTRDLFLVQIYFWQSQMLSPLIFSVLQLTVPLF